MDVEALAGELLAPGSVFAFLAKHRGRLFPDSMMEDLFLSRRGRPSVPAPVIGSVPVLQGLSDREIAEAALTYDLRLKAACGYGPDALQSNTLNAAKVDEARKVVTAFRQMLPILGVPEDSHDEAVQVIADLEEEASAPEPKQNRIKNLLSKSLELIALGTAGGAADTLGAMTKSAIDGLG